MRQGVISCLFIKIKGVHDESLQTQCAAQHYQTTLANSLRGHGVVVAAASASVSMKPHEREIEKNLSNLVVSKPAAVRRVPFVIQIAFLSPLLKFMFSKKATKFDVK